MTKRLFSIALAAGAAVAFAAPGNASAAVMCTDRPVLDCVKEWVGPIGDVIDVPCIPSGDLDPPC